MALDKIVKGTRVRDLGKVMEEMYALKGNGKWCSGFNMLYCRLSQVVCKVTAVKLERLEVEIAMGHPKGGGSKSSEEVSLAPRRVKMRLDGNC